MKRREFIAGLGGAAAWPIAARAQQPGKLPTIGYIGQTQGSQFTTAFLGRLRELGWIEGRNVTIAYRWAEARPDRVAEIAAEFVRMKVDIIHVSGTGSALLAKRATSVIPIVFAVAADPVGLGTVSSLARPGGNVTGLTNQLTELAGKRLELLRAIVPGLRRIGMMDAGLGSGSPLSELEMREVQAAANSLGLDFIMLELRQKEDIAIAFNGLKDHADALYVANRPFPAANRMRIITSALVARLPTVFAARDWVDAGGLLSYGANFHDLFRRSAEYVDKILRGTSPADIPVEQPTKFEMFYQVGAYAGQIIRNTKPTDLPVFQQSNRFEFIINLQTAHALGIDVPPGLLALADEVIE